jgi:hypothetical protein
MTKEEMKEIFEVTTSFQRSFKQDGINKFRYYDVKDCEHTELNSCAKCDPKFMERLMTDIEQEQIEIASDLNGEDDFEMDDETYQLMCNLGKPLNNFHDYGFTADFQGEILKEVDGIFVGYFINDGHLIGCSWGRKGSNRVNNEFNLTPIKKEDEEFNSMDNSNSNSNSNSNNDGIDTTHTAINNFQDYGFAADFEGMISFIDHRDFRIGYTNNEIGIIARMWNKYGDCFSIDGDKISTEFNLTPIKKEWHEQRPLKFPFAVSDTFNIRLVHGYDDLALAIDSGYDKATKEEVMSVYFDEEN